MPSQETVNGPAPGAHSKDPRQQNLERHDPTEWREYPGRLGLTMQGCLNGIALLYGVTPALIRFEFRQQAGKSMKRHWPMLRISEFRRQVTELPGIQVLRDVPLWSRCHWDQVLSAHDLLATIAYDLGE